MTSNIRVGIVGYGNLGKGVELALKSNPDMELKVIFTRRNPESFGSGLFRHISEAEKFKDELDVLILCGGSATDLPEQGPQFAAMFNTVDSFDTHASIPEYFAKVDAAAKSAGKVAVISTGWDPGLFSLNRLLAECILPEGTNYTFWGPGVSQGHSDAIRRVPGVKHGVQYTVPIESAVERVRSGENPELSTREKHRRVCYVVAEEGADREQIAKTIKEMPNYFADYDTEVHFIDYEEFKANHSAMPHGGMVIRGAKTGVDREHNQVYEFKLSLGSNPEFTGSVLVAYARAVHKLHQQGETGAKTVFDIPFAYLSPYSGDELRKRLL